MDVLSMFAALLAVGLALALPPVGGTANVPRSESLRTATFSSTGAGITYRGGTDAANFIRQAFQDELSGYRRYNNSLHNFAERVEEGLGMGPLPQIHAVLGTGRLSPEEEEAFYDTLPVFGVNDRKSPFVRRFYQLYDADPAWEAAYLRFVRSVLMPALFPRETRLVVQRAPNIRFHLPGQTNIGRRPSDPSTEVVGLHSDHEFGHRPDELNIVLPLTAMGGSNSIFYEPPPCLRRGAGEGGPLASPTAVEDFRVVEAQPGELFFGYLNECLHYNQINHSGKTRVSFDFRVVPGSSYFGAGAGASPSVRSATSKQKFTVGDYYTLILR